MGSTGRPLKPCGHPGCRALVGDGTNRCPAHKPEAWAKRADAPHRITGSRLQRLRADLFAREPLCRLCAAAGRVRLATQRDHIQSLGDGGTEAPENEQPLCDECHQGKTLGEALRARKRN